MTEPDRARHDAEAHQLLNPAHVLEGAAADLAHRFHGTFSAETVARCVEESYALLAANARIQRHLPVLAARFAADRLTAQAQAHGAIGKPVPEVLFLCTRNAGRSQMAAALLAHHANGQVHVRSAGSEPDGDIEELVLDALRELGIESSEGYPKPITDEVLQAADVIVTMGCQDACPVLSGKRYLDWDIHDPEGQPLHVVRAIHDDINYRVQALMAELTIQHHHSETP